MQLLITIKIIQKYKNRLRLVRVTIEYRTPRFMEHNVLLIRLETPIRPAMKTFRASKRYRSYESSQYRPTSSYSQCSAFARGRYNDLWLVEFR